MKASTLKLSRQQAKELLGNVDLALGSSSGKNARDEVVRLLNKAVPTYSWVGIYRVDATNLILDAWAGPAPTEHTKIPIGKGVCGYAAKAGHSEIVSDVSKDPRYLECFPSTRAEIVVPIFNSEKVVGEIDIDSEHLDAFSSIDREFLEAVARKISGHALE